MEKLGFYTCQPGILCSTIRCTLSHVVLPPDDNIYGSIHSRTLDYHALSYTWGPATPTAPIFCNGQVLEVTKNLHEALLYLRHRGVQRLWIDAICIDQSNLEERSSQVQLMKQIYERASSLAVWLGRGTRSSVEGFRFLDFVHSRVPYTFDQPAFDLNLFHDCSDENFEALACLLNKDWFSRAWIIQEVISGKHKAMVYCGKTGRTWSHFASGIDAIAYSGLLNSIPDTNGALSRVFEQLQLFRNVETSDLELADLVAMARSAQATDPRDKIYALLGLASDAEILYKIIDGRRTQFEVDYTKPVKDVYTDATQAMIIRSGLQGVLTQARRQTPSAYGLPTWVPDWSIPRAESGIDQNLWHNGVLRINRSDDRLTPAESRLLKPFEVSQRYSRPSFHEDGRLQVSGIQFDVLESLSGAYPGTKSQGAEMITWLGICDQLVTQCLPDATSSSRTEVLWRTLIADRMGNSRPAPPTVGADFQRSREFLDMLQQPWEDAGTEFLSIMPSLMSMNSEIAIRCRSRQVGRTQGNYLCLVPDTARIHDTVAIIDGCSVPTILRRSQGTFQLIGDCYVHGIMYGNIKKPVSGSLRGQSLGSKHERTEIFIR